MRIVLFLFGFLFIKNSEGKPTNSLIENEVNEMKQRLVGPLLDKTKNADTVLAEMRKLYENNMSRLNNKISLIEKGRAEEASPTPSPAEDSCKRFQEDLQSAQEVSNEAALLALHVVANLTNVVLTSEDCLTIWIFSAVSCTAHKLKDAKDIYVQNRATLLDIEDKLANALKVAGKDFVACFKRMNI